MSSSQLRPAFPLERLSTPEMLARIEPFQASTPQALAQISGSVERCQQAANVQILESGSQSEALYIVLRGRVNLVRTLDAGRDLILCSLGPGSVFGESCLVDGMKVSAHAYSAIPTQLAKVPASQLRQQIALHPNLMPSLMKLLGERLNEVESLASGLALCDVEQRLRQTLARLVKGQGRKSGTDAGWILAPVPTQSELARMVGSCRETVSRTLSGMARNGLLSSKGRRMVVADSLIAEAAF